MFTKMSEGTKEEWEHISQEHAPHIMDMPTRVIEMLKQLEGLSLGFGTNQLHHALQTATMAKRAGAEDEMILISLIHDMGKVVNVPNHGQICAEIIKPYVSDDAYHIIRTHQDTSKANIIITTWVSQEIFEKTMKMSLGMKKLSNLPMSGIKRLLIQSMTQSL